MAEVVLTSHLFAFFPHLRGRKLVVEASNVAGVVEELERLAPGFAFYVCDERGRLRRHVNIFVDKEMICDRKALSDAVRPETQGFIAQALSGG